MIQELLQRPAQPDGVAAAAVMGRDMRLDMFRGVALVMIFVNHVPGTFYEQFTSRNFGFSDAAEAFVLMSGIAAGLAYSGGFRSGSLWAATAKVWARARHLYFMHIVITMLCIAIFAGAAKWFDLTELLTKNNLRALFQQPLSTLVGIPTMLHQLGYLNILPLYIVLLLISPIAIMIGLRRPLLLLYLSMALWALSAHFRWNLPAFPNPGGWFFSPFTWQLIFVAGLVGGIGMKQGNLIYRYNPIAFWSAGAALLLILIWVKVPAIAEIGRAGLRTLSNAGLPFYLTGFDKTYSALMRVGHALALAYVVSSIPFMHVVARHALAWPLVLMGKNGLAVFATGTVVSMGLQSVRAGVETTIATDGMLLLAGLGIQIGLAMALEATKRVRSTRPPAR